MTSKVYKWTTRSLLLVSAFFACSQIVSIGSGKKQPDFRTYYYASMAYEHGLNPYKMESLQRVSSINDLKYSFVYPPHTLAAFLPLSHIGYYPAYYLYFALKILALLALIYLWMRIVPAAQSDWWALWVTVLLGYRFSVLRELRAGNVSVFEQLLLWGGIFLFLQNRRFAGGVSILLSSLFKLVTITLVPLMVIIQRSRNSLSLLFGICAIGLAGFILFINMQPELWSSFFQAARSLDERGNSSPSSLAFIFDIRDAINLRNGTAYIIYGAWCCIVFGALALSYFVTRHSKDVFPMLYLFLFAYVITVPRMKDYSYIICLLPTLHILSAMVKGRGQSIAGCVFLWVPLISYQSLWMACYAFGLTLNWIIKYRSMPHMKIELTLNPLRIFTESHT